MASISASTAAMASACVEDFQDGLGEEGPAGREGDDPASGLLEGPGVGEVGRGLQAGDVALAEPPGVLPEGEAGELVRSEPEDDRLAAAGGPEHGQGPAFGAFAPEVGEVDLLGEAGLGGAVGGPAAEALARPGRLAGTRVSIGAAKSEPSPRKGGPKFQW